MSGGACGAGERGFRQSDHQAIYKVTGEALQRGDLAKVSTHLTSDYKQRLISGKVMNKKQALQALAQGQKKVPMKMLPLKIHSMQVKGNRATVVASGGVVMRIHLPDGRADTIHTIGKTRDHWIKIGGVWKERLVEQLSEEIRVNGEVISKNGKPTFPT